MKSLCLLIELLTTIKTTNIVCYLNDLHQTLEVDHWKVMFDAVCLINYITRTFHKLY